MIEIVGCQGYGDQDNKFKFAFKIDGKQSSKVAETEDVAMILALAEKYDGINSQAGKLFLRMLKIKTAWVD